ncbi:MAG: type II toxin-antitoxin system HicA family toxin [Aerococcus suis]|nr:type II toxin-antitoxin system HicA family toxin [Aerococcus suis]MDY4646281.1 type II toxin-antitoxin system HicA family toxin [Aerococcus suis]
MPKKPKQLVKLLKQNGFIEKSQNGSHKKMYNPSTNRTTIVPMHRKDISDSFLKEILKQAGLR